MRNNSVYMQISVGQDLRLNSEVEDIDFKIERTRLGRNIYNTLSLEERQILENDAQRVDRLITVARFRAKQIMSVQR